jgi:hypothetical protein
MAAERFLSVKNEFDRLTETLLLSGGNRADWRCRGEGRRVWVKEEAQHQLLLYDPPLVVVVLERTANRLAVPSTTVTKGKQKRRGRPLTVALFTLGTPTDKERELGLSKARKEAPSNFFFSPSEYVSDDASFSPHFFVVPSQHLWTHPFLLFKQNLLNIRAPNFSQQQQSLLDLSFPSFLYAVSPYAVLAQAFCPSWLVFTDQQP